MFGSLLSCSILQLQSGLGINGKDKTLDSLCALDKLIYNAGETDSRYLGTLGTFIKYSRGLYLTSALQVVSNMLNSKFYVLPPTLEHPLLRTLELIITGFKELDFEENLALKKSAAKLAFELSGYYLTCESSVPLVISMWMNTCDSDDEFSEVRNQWRR